MSSSVPTLTLCTWTFFQIQLFHEMPLSQEWLLARWHSERLHSGAAWWNVFLPQMPTPSCTVKKISHIHFPSHEGRKARRLRKSVLLQHLSVIGLRAWAAETHVLCITVTRPCIYVCLVCFLQQLSFSTAMPWYHTVNQIHPYCLRLFLQPRQRDLSLWFMHQVDIRLSCLVWGTAFISCPTFI